MVESWLFWITIVSRLARVRSVMISGTLITMYVVIISSRVFESVGLPSFFGSVSASSHTVVCTSMILLWPDFTCWPLSSQSPEVALEHVLSEPATTDPAREGPLLVNRLRR